MTRRDFLGGAGSLGVTALFGGCATGPTRAPALAGDFSWGVLVHLGRNMWGDWAFDAPRVTSAKEEEAFVATHKVEKGKRPFMAREYMSAEWKYWVKHLDYIKEQGLNMVYIDIGEAYAYPSHPELWVKGSLTTEQMRKELARIRAMGLEPIPKLNFSAGHDQWLKQYHFMTSTSKYYKVVADVIRDVCEVFDTPRYFHLGFDEETYAAVKNRAMCVLRQGQLWWHDLNYCVREVESHGARAMVWSDKICGGREEFYKNMPKSVIQVPWYYGKDFSKEKVTWKPEYEKKQDWSIQRNLAASIAELADKGYDIIPCTSNWSAPEASDAMLKYCKENIDAKRIIGYMSAPWRMPLAKDDEKVMAGIRLFAEAKRKYY